MTSSHPLPRPDNWYGLTPASNYSLTEHLRLIDKIPMRFDPQAGVTGGHGKPDDSRRRHGRLPQELLNCNLGEVLNISAGGMRVLCRCVPPSRVHVVLEGHPLPGPLMASLAWCKKEGMFRHVAGYKFVDLTPAIVECLSSIASVNRFRRAM